MNKDKCNPFIVWVGGKSRLASRLMEYVPSNCNNYYEPFLGGGALFFSLRDKFKKAYLSDVNFDLVTSFNAIKSTPEEVCKLVDTHEQSHSKEYFYQIREVSDSNNPAAISARFLYLNRYSFRGIYRLNFNGKLTSTIASRSYKSRISDKVHVNSKALKNATIYASDFSFIEASSGDFVYFDPPYHKSGEKFYTRLPFDESEQIRLKNFIDQLTAKNVKIMLSNSGTNFITDLYKDYNIRIIDIKYAINNHKTSKQEVIITNY